MAREVYVEHELARQTLRVYVCAGENELGRVFYYRAPGDETLRIETVPRGGKPPMYMRIDADIAQALGEALAPRPEATERHLDDAITVRDRLLLLVEGMAR